MTDHDSIVSSDKLEAIADAIRDKTHKSGKLTLDQMPDEIESISGGGGETPDCGIVPTSWSEDGFVLSADSYGNVQNSAMYHDTTEYSGIDPHAYLQYETDPFDVGHSNSTNGAYNYISSVTFVTAPTIVAASAFDQCYWLDISELPEGLEEIGSRAFSQCYNLSITEIPESVNFIGSYAFDDAGKFFKTCPNYDDTETYSIGDTAYNTNYIYTCVEDVTSPEYFDSSKWIEGWYPEILGKYDPNAIYTSGDTVYDANYDLGNGHVNTAYVASASSDIWYDIAEEVTNYKGMYQIGASYNIGDVVYSGDYSCDGNFFTWIRDTDHALEPEDEIDEGSLIYGVYPEILGRYDEQQSYSVGDVIFNGGFGSDGYICTIIQDVPVGHELDPDDCLQLVYAPHITVYTEGSTYNPGDTIYTSESGGEGGANGLYTCLKYIANAEDFSTEYDAGYWVQGYYPGLLGEHDRSTEYHIGDVVVNIIWGDPKIYTCTQDNIDGSLSDGSCWVSGYYPHIVGNYDPTDAYSLGDIVNTTDGGSGSEGIKILLAEGGEGGEVGFIEGYCPELLGTYDPNRVYHAGDIVLYSDSGSYSDNDLFICIESDSTTGEFDEYSWISWSVGIASGSASTSGTKFPLYFKGTPTEIASDAFTSSVYNIAFVPWSEGSGPDIEEQFEAVVYDYNPNNRT